MKPCVPLEHGAFPFYEEGQIYHTPYTTPVKRYKIIIERHLRTRDGSVGIVIRRRTNDMKRTARHHKPKWPIILILSGLLASFGVAAGVLAGTAGGDSYPSTDDRQAMSWNQVFGSSNSDYFNAVQVLPDGTILAAGSAAETGGEITDPKNGANIYSVYADGLLVKFDAAGNKLWDQMYGGSGTDVFKAITVLADGSILAAGYTDSDASGELTLGTSGGYDGFLVKFNANGAPIWHQIVGGTGDDYFTDLAVLSDGSIVAAGYSNSAADGRLTDGTNGGYDGLLVKFDQTGSMQWNTQIGGTGNDYLNAVALQTDGIVCAGRTQSGATGDLTDPTNGSDEALLIKTSTTGTLLWNQLYGGSGVDYLNDLAVLADDTLVAVGQSNSPIDGELTAAAANNGGVDGLLVRFDAAGTPLWNQLFGGAGNDVLSALRILDDGSYLTAGYSTTSATGDITDTNSGNADGLLAKFTDDGTPAWSRLTGGTANDYYNALAIAGTGSVTAGSTLSSGDGRLTDTSNGQSDGLLVGYVRATLHTPVLTAADSRVTDAGTTPDLKALFAAKATDSEDGTLTTGISVNDGAVDYNTPGTYTITFSVTDSDANTVTLDASLKVQAAVDRSGTYWIQSKKSSLVMDVNGGSTAQGADIIQWTFHGRSNQQWKIEALGNGYYKITSVLNPAYSLDIYDGSTTLGNRVIQWPYHGGINQQWKIIANGDGTVSITSRLAEEGGKDYLLDVYGGSTDNGAKVIQWTAHYGDNQKWTLKPVPAAKDYSGTWFVRSVNSSLVMDIYGGGTAQGVNIIQWPQKATGNANQQWIFTDLGNGYYQVTSVLSGMSLDVYGGSTDAGANIIQWPYHGGTNQQWKVLENYDAAGNVVSVSLMSRLALESGTKYLLDVYGGGTIPGVNIIQWPAHYRANQQWTLEAVD